MDVMHVGSSDRMARVMKSFPEHIHGYWEIIYNEQGSGIMTVKDQRYTFEPGDIAVIPPYTEHKKESEKGFADVCMFIKNFRPIGRSSFRILRDDEEGTVGGLMRMARRYYEGKSVYEKAVLNVIGDLLYQVLTLFYMKKQKKDLRLEGIMEVMQNNLDNPDFDLSSAIAKTGYAKDYFRRIFRTFTGESPVNYFQKMRVEYAKSLMNQYSNSRSIKDIASSCGFKDALYFSRIFKKVEGMSPRAYMEQQFSCDHELIRMNEKTGGR